MRPLIVITIFAIVEF